MRKQQRLCWVRQAGCASIFKRNLEKSLENLQLFNHHQFWVIFDFLVLVRICACMVLIATESHFIVDLLWLSSVVDKRELLAPWQDNIEDRNVAFCFAFSLQIQSVTGSRLWLQGGNCRL